MLEITKYNKILKRKKYLLSLSIFKIKGPYRAFEKYTRFLDRILNHTYNNNYSFDIRVYFDSSCQKELELFITKYKNVEFYKFNYPPLRLGEFHDGTFGSLIRLLPIFEKQGFNNTKIDHVYDYIWIDDIDILPINLNLEFINYIIDNKINTIFLSIFCYQRPWINNNYNMNFPLITNIKLSNNIFIKFIEDISNNKYKNIVEEVKKFRSDRYIYDYPVRFPYGMDEYFTNFIIYDLLCEFNTYIIYDTDITKLFKKIIKKATYDDINTDTYNKDIILKLLDLHEISYKTENRNIKRDINNTYINLFNKINKEKLLKMLDEFDKNCYNEFIDFLKKYDMKDINNFKIIMKL